MECQKLIWLVVLNARAFADSGKNNDGWAFNSILEFMHFQKERFNRKEITAGTIRNYNDVMTVKYLPKGSSEFSAVEECCRQGKDTLLVSKYYPRFTNLKAAITNYYRTKRFNLNIVKYLMRVC